MKRYLGMVLSLVMAFVMVTGAYAAETDEGQEQVMQTFSSTALPDVKFTVYATNYSRTYNGMTCFCTMNSNCTYITVKSSCSGSSLSIISRSYASWEDASVLNMNGSGGAGGTSTANASYTAISRAKVVYNEHRNISTGYLVQGWLDYTV